MPYIERVLENLNEPVPSSVMAGGVHTDIVATCTMTVAQLRSGLLACTSAGAVTYTTLSAKEIVAAFPGIGVGHKIELFTRNDGSSSGTLTLAAGIGVTLHAGNTNTVAIQKTKLWLFEIANVNPGSEAVTVFSMYEDEQ
jgi:hypothetical protein